ncbi:Crp/Fnr family transcriptional regulator [Joostella atrarenae]|uniref:Crp/Fnr family transcriptional regulator n=1 Tax=Joostella atrarenae TaxID=679257 RepID=A0ABS9J2B2_9FLAO|nr:Crp/Fnr family transcriptional regulator [Joostella atrarenae]MCF8714493.1 Crp/Fnr family transcriptional regulator [Joostella atrarenae]
MPFNLLKKHIAKHITLSKEELAIYCASFYPKTLSKKEYLLKQGAICKFEGYVTKGCLRVFTLDKNGKEHVLYFAVEDWWVTDIDSFTNGTPSYLSIQALEDSEVLLIDKEGKELLYETLPSIEKLFRVMSQKAMVVLQQRTISNNSKTAEERYLDFIEKYPHIVQRLTNLQLASYLGITHEFLSKIRSKIISKKQ